MNSFFAAHQSAMEAVRRIFAVEPQSTVRQDDDGTYVISFGPYGHPQSGNIYVAAYGDGSGFIVWFQSHDNDVVLPERRQFRADEGGISDAVEFATEFLRSQPTVELVA